MDETLPAIPAGYGPLLEDLKQRIRTAQMRAAVSVNRELVLLYWNIGRQILAAQGTQGWGAKVIDRLSIDLRRTFPDMRGFSPRNLKYMRAFAEAWAGEIVQEPLAQLTWYHNLTLLEKLDGAELRLWYAQQTLEYGWSRNVLAHHIGSRLHERQGQAVTNFDRTLPPLQSDLARQITKDPYNFEFLTLQRDAEERALEKGLIGHLQKFLLELGTGFAFVGSQFHLETIEIDNLPLLVIYWDTSAVLSALLQDVHSRDARVWLARNTVSPQLRTTRQRPGQVTEMFIASL